MNNYPIGVFDSGLGGFTCVPPLCKELPHESIIYFGDTARTPYGDKAPETIQYFTCQITDFLVSKGAKVLVIACNTISALCTDMLRERYPEIPIIDIISPTVEYIASTEPQDKPIGIIATKATTKSGLYEWLLHEKGVKAPVYSKACPLFVPLIESGFREGVVVESIVRHYLDDFVAEHGIKRLVLGCTHYPYIKQTIQQLYPDIEIINPSEIISREVGRVLEQLDLQAAPDAEHFHRFYASDLSEVFLEMILHNNADDHYRVKFKEFKEIYK